jgi:hypothetical protein
VLLLDSGPALSPEAVHAQALELCLRRAGLRALLLSADIAERRYSTALRALNPVAVLICGSDARLDVLGEPLRRAMRGSDATPFSYRSARLVGGKNGMPSLGNRPGEAATLLIAALDLS